MFLYNLKRYERSTHLLSEGTAVQLQKHCEGSSESKLRPREKGFILAQGMG